MEPTVRPATRASSPGASTEWRGSFGANETLETITRAYAEQTDAERVIVIAWLPGERAVRALATWGLPPHDELRLDRGDPLAQRLLSGGAGLHDVSGDDLPLMTSGPGGEAITRTLSTPLRSPGGIEGSLIAGFSRRPRLEGAALVWTSEAYCAVAALSLSGSATLRALVEAAQRDGLTDCLNYTGLCQALDREVSRSTRHGRPLACCFIDLDGFKAVNDRHGNLQGNNVLAAVGHSLRARVRSFDLVARYGGDEFVLVLPDTDMCAARMLARRLHTDIAEASKAVIGTPMTASIGIVAWTAGQCAEDLLALADLSLRGAGSTASIHSDERPASRIRRFLLSRAIRRSRVAGHDR